MNIKSTLSVVYACLTVVSFNASAVIIGPDNFGPNALVEDYENLGLPPSFISPVVIGDDVYTATSVTSGLQYNDRNCLSGFCMEANGSQTVFIDLGNMVNRTGIYMLASNSGDTHRATYYDADGVTLGTDNIGLLLAPGLRFYGFESLDNPIARIKYQFGAGAFQAVHFDNFTTEAVVPVPAAVWLFGSGLIGLIGVARRKA